MSEVLKTDAVGLGPEFREDPGVDDIAPYVHLYYSDDTDDDDGVSYLIITASPDMTDWDTLKMLTEATANLVRHGDFALPGLPADLQEQLRQQ